MDSLFPFAMAGDVSLPGILPSGLTSAKIKQKMTDECEQKLGRSTFSNFGLETGKA